MLTSLNSFKIFLFTLQDSTVHYIPFCYLSFRTAKRTFLRHTGIQGRSLFFRGTTKTVLSLFRTLFFRNVTMAKPRFNTQMFEVPKICEFEVSALIKQKDLLAFFLLSKIQECIEGCYICIKIVL
jgi:hypothetical protein